MKRFYFFILLILAACPAFAQNVSIGNILMNGQQVASEAATINTIKTVQKGAVTVAVGTVETNLSFASGGDPNLYLVYAYMSGAPGYSMEVAAYGFTFPRWNGAFPSNLTSLVSFGGSIAFSSSSGTFQIITTNNSGAAGTLAYSVIKMSNF